MNDTSHPKNPFLVTPFRIGSRPSLDETKVEEQPSSDQNQVVVPRETFEKWQEILEAAKQLKTRYDRLRSAFQRLADRLRAREEKTQGRDRRLDAERLLFLVGQLKRAGWRPKSRRLALLAEMETLLTEVLNAHRQAGRDPESPPVKTE
jgi:molecular chaperone GrpE (heat shock protein)